jgi:hypothetical protein
MVGSEMLTMLPLRVLMKAPTDTAESTSHFPLFGEEACPDVTLSSFPVRTSEPASTRSPIPLRSRLRCPLTNNTRGVVTSEARVLLKQVEPLAIEVQSGTALGQHRAESQP